MSIFHFCSKFYVLLTKSIFWEVWPRQIWFQQMCFSLLSLTSKSVTALNNNEARKPLSVWICSCGKLLTVHRSCTTSTGAWKLLPGRGGGPGRWAVFVSGQVGGGFNAITSLSGRCLFVPCCHSPPSPLQHLPHLSNVFLQLLLSRPLQPRKRKWWRHIASSCCVAVVKLTTLYIYVFDRKYYVTWEMKNYDFFCWVIRFSLCHILVQAKKISGDH